MSYPASPNGAGAIRVRPDAAQFWAGAAATAVVAALIALVGILVSRWALGIPILAPTGDGAWGNAHTGEYALLAALAALIAAGLLYLLELGAPAPRVFFGWIVGLATLAAVVYPFSTSAPLEQKAATAIVNLILGIAIASLLSAVAARAIRISRTAPPAYGQPRPQGYDQSRPQGYDQSRPQGYDQSRPQGYGQPRPQPYGQTEPLNRPDPPPADRPGSSPTPPNDWR
jgi:Family of unknown function (DUF6069)